MALFDPALSRRALTGQAIWFSVWLIITIIAIVLVPDAHGHGTHQQMGFPPCPSVMLFDRPCPGCGLTTSWTALLHGNFGLAFASHPFGPLLYLLFTASAFACLFGFVKTQRFDSDTRWVNVSVKVFVSVFIAFGLIRFATTPHFATEREQMITRFVTGR